jgi:hypothetical protein
MIAIVFFKSRYQQFAVCGCGIAEAARDYYSHLFLAQVYLN